MDRTTLIEIILHHNFNITPDALDYLLKKKISEDFFQKKIKRIPQDIPVITVTTLEKYLEVQEFVIDEFKKKEENIIDDSEKKMTNSLKIEENKEQKQRKSQILEEKKEKTPFIRSPHIKISKDIPEKSSEKPDIVAFRKLFRDRYNQLSTILRENLPSSSSVLKRNLMIDEIPQNKEGILIGMVQDTRVLHTNKFVIQLEDLESEIITNCVIVQDSDSFSGYRNIIRDSVVAVSGVLPKNYIGGAVTAFWGKNIIRPGFKPIKFKQSSHSNKILFISDIHFGSKFFSQNIFTRLIKFLTLQDLSFDYKNIAEEISTIIIAGDLVEGIGTFSDEKDQLLLHSINAQYKGLGTLLKEIPEHIQIIIIPGEHDATQAALPQPEIEKQISISLTGLPNVRSCGNPLRLSIDELNLLVFHGQGNETLFQKQNSEDLILGTQHLLEYRHLCPEYGSFTPLAPFKKDYLVINEIPDVFVLGHFHQAHFSEYKGVKIITCGSFKKSIQKGQKTKNDLSIGKIPVLDTLTGRVEILDLKTI